MCMYPNSYDEISAWPCHRFTILDFGWESLYKLLNHSLLSPDELASKAPRSILESFDSNGRISRVTAEVRPHEDWLLLQPFLSSLWLETIVSRCKSVCMVNWAMNMWKWQDNMKKWYKQTKNAWTISFHRLRPLKILMVTQGEPMARLSKASPQWNRQAVSTYLSG